ncbi:MAG TPA: enoyl-CoA hydratase-related protein [Acidimicrobiales bacterium]|nr:enoyl-CoA hydratase-related protein [Acidimicrobiales bacterium]
MPVGYGASMLDDQVFVTVDRRPDGVALIRLDRPRANALSAALLRQLRAIAEALAEDPPGAVVVWGGDRIFAAGADIVQLEEGPGDVSTNFAAALGALARLPRVVIAAVNGYALGGGMELALACDLRICADDAKFGLPEILLGVIPGGGGTQRLARLIGVGRAKELVLTGRQVRAEEALAIGLVNRVVPRREVLDEALRLAAQLAAGPLVAQEAAKAAIDRGLEVTLEEGLAIERDQFVVTSRTEDAARGIRSFLEHGPGKATFVGR